MCRILTVLAAVVLFAPAAVAADPKDKPSETAQKFEALQKDYLQALDAADKLRWAGKTAEAHTALERSNAAALLPKMLELAFFNPSDPVSIDVLQFLSVHGASDAYLCDQVMVLIRRDYLASAKLKHIVHRMDKHTDETADTLRAVIAKNPDRKIAAQACAHLADYLNHEVTAADAITKHDFLKPLLERRAGDDYVKKILSEMDKNKKEVRDLTDLLADKYKGVLPDVADGKPLPDATVEDLAGKKIKLADLHGKVVVLTILSVHDTLAPAIVKHEGELAKMYADKPLTFVTIFADEKKETVNAFLKQVPASGTSAWGGDNLLENWNLAATPTIIVVDAKGVLRSQSNDADGLDDVLPDLVKEAEKK